MDVGEAVRLAVGTVVDVVDMDDGETVLGVVVVDDEDTATVVDTTNVPVVFVAARK